MSAAAWLAPHSARNVQFTYISPYPPDPDSATQESALFSQFPANPPLAKANCAFNPLLFLSPPCPGNPLVVLIVCGKQGQSGVGGRGSDERRPLLTPAGLHPPTLLLVNRPLFRHLITPGKPPHHPAIIPRGDPDHFARPNGRHSLWVFKAQLLTSGWRAARWGTQRDRGPSTWLGSSMARSSTCSTMATAGLVDGSNPRSWLQMAAGQESRPSLPATATHRHRPPSHIFYTSLLLQSPIRGSKTAILGRKQTH